MPYVYDPLFIAKNIYEKNFAMLCKSSSSGTGIDIQVLTYLFFL